MPDILIDVDIIVDICIKQQPHYETSLAAVDYCTKVGHSAWLYVGSVQTLHSTLAHQLSRMASEKGHITTSSDFSQQAASLLQEFAEGKQWLAALAEDGPVFSDSHPQDLQLVNAVQRLAPDARLLTRNTRLLDRCVQAITPENYLELQLTRPPLAFIDLKVQQTAIRTRLENRLHRALHHGQYIMGPEIEELEACLAAYVGVKHCITVSSGTDALMIAMMALNIGLEDEVITTPFTFISTAEMIALLGAKPVFIDIDPRTYNLDPSLIEAAITPKTRAIMPVSLYGQCADLDAINAIAKRYGLSVIEDGAQSFGATYKGRKSCALSVIGATSFFPSKPLGCYGDGGACFTDDDELAIIMRQIRVHGQDRRYHHSRLGINGRIDTMQAAVLLAKLEAFPGEVDARSQIGCRYTELLRDFVTTPYVEPYNTSVYAQYTIQVDQRSKVQERLKERGVPTAIHYPFPLHHQPALAQPNVQLSQAERAAQRVLSLPMSPWLSEHELMTVVEAVKMVAKSLY